MKNFATLSEFKKVLTIGDTVNCIFHRAFAGRNKAGEMQYKEEPREPRPVSIKQSNSFALKTIKTTGEVTDSWCYYPKASDCKIENNNTLQIFETDRDGKVYPILTYSIN